MTGLVHARAWGGRRRAWGRSGGGASDVFSQYTWDIEYDCPDVSGTSWPEANGLANHDLSASSAAATGQSTSGLTNGALGADRVDAAVSPTGASGGYTVASTFDWTDQQFHCRFLASLDTPLAGNRVCRFTTGGSDLFEIRWITTTQLRWSARSAIVNCTVDIDPFPTGSYQLCDFNVNGNTISLYVNGTSHTPSACAIAPDFTGLGNFGLMALENTTNAAPGDYVFFGIRFGETLSEADHDADAVALGL